MADAPKTSNLRICRDCGGPIGAGSNHEVDRCQDIQIARQQAEIERLEECIRGMSAHAMKAAAEETRLRAALKWIEDHAFDVERIGLAERATNTLRATPETSP